MRPDLLRESPATLNDSAISVIDVYAEGAINWIDELIKSYESKGDANAKESAIELISPAVNYNRAQFQDFAQEKFKDFLSGEIDKESTLYKTLDVRYRFLNTLSINCNGDFGTEDQRIMLGQVRRVISYDGVEEQLKKQITNHYQNKIKEHLQEISTPRTAVARPTIQEFKKQADDMENQR